jgi:hypothetical protein
MVHRTGSEGDVGMGFCAMMAGGVVRVEVVDCDGSMITRVRFNQSF